MQGSNILIREYITIIKTAIN